MTGYEFKVFYDREFKNEFVSIGNSSTFNTSSSGTIGSANATFTISHGSNFPDRLYYSLEKSGFISTSDKEVKNYSEILFVDSVYNKEYHCFGSWDQRLLKLLWRRFQKNFLILLQNVII